MRGKALLPALRKALKENADEKLQNVHQHFFKENISCYGYKSADVGKLAKTYLAQLNGLSKNDVFALCEELWQSGMMEEAQIACCWSETLHKQYEPSDFKVFERWVTRYVSNWAMCDTLCNHTVGDFVMMYPQFIEELKRWATSENRWTRRAAAVSLIIPARRGLFLDDIFEIAGTLLSDTDDMVQKGYGWMLKAASQAHEQAVFDYVISKKATMPRTAYRYAIEKMSPERKKKAMEKEG
jgi:3-methyladenine DNA glycosylase AlkD